LKDMGLHIGIRPGIKWRRGAATRDSYPPCGGGTEWGVVQYGTAVPHRPTPTPLPSPQGGGEGFAASSNRISAAIGRGPLVYPTIKSENTSGERIFLMNRRTAAWSPLAR